MNDDTDEYEGHELLMHNYNTLPENCQKYWRKRYDFFSKYDEGVYMTLELWYSVTPEQCAKFTASLCRQLIAQVSCKDSYTVVDVCCGSGGNAIQFAKMFDKVIAVDNNKTHLYCTQHNCEVYGVSDNVTTLLGDWVELSENPDWIPRLGIDIMFASPPWGGPSYKKTTKNKINIFDLYKMLPLDIDTLVGTMLKHCKDIMLFLPKNSNRDHLLEVKEKYYGPESFCKIIYVQNSNFNATIAMLAIFGPIAHLDYSFKEKFLPYDYNYV